jgi:hypothetical protein
MCRLLVNLTGWGNWRLGDFAEMGFTGCLFNVLLPCNKESNVAPAPCAVFSTGPMFRRDLTRRSSAYEAHILALFGDH